MALRVVADVEQGVGRSVRDRDRLEELAGAGSLLVHDDAAAGLEDTVPAPLPALLSASVLSDSNVAVAARSAPTVTVQVPVPEQSPDQPVNDDPGAAVAVSVIGAAAKGAEHVGPQLIPPALELTVPEPLPALATVSVGPR